MLVDEFYIDNLLRGTHAENLLPIPHFIQKEAFFHLKWVHLFRKISVVPRFF